MGNNFIHLAIVLNGNHSILAVNFAVYCAATSCGVGWDLLNDENLYIASLFYFHMYFTVRKILYEMVMPIPGDDVFDVLNNRYDN